MASSFAQTSRAGRAAWTRAPSAASRSVAPPQVQPQRCPLSARQMLRTASTASTPATPGTAQPSSSSHADVRPTNTAAAAAAAAAAPATTTQSGTPQASSSALGTTRRQLPRYNIEIGPVQQSRYEDHYHHTLARDLLYMTYEHKSSTPHVASGAASLSGRLGTDLAAGDATAAKTSSLQRSWDPASPYSKNRPARANRGNRQLAPSADRRSADIVALDRIVITAFCKEAITNKQALIPLLAQMRAITGKPIEGSMADPRMRTPEQLSKQGVIRVLRAKTSIATFKLRRGMPIGVQVELPAKSALEFLEVFSTFVLPRLRTFSGFLLPPSSQPLTGPAAQSGVVSLGMGPDALSQFPQTEINWDAYPSQRVGFQVDCITNQRGRGATERARQLLSGLGIPFVRRGL